MGRYLVMVHRMVILWSIANSCIMHVCKKRHCPLRHFNSAGSKMVYCKRNANRKSLLVLRNSVADVCIETNNVKTSVGGKLDILCGQLMSACLYNKIYYFG